MLAGAAASTVALGGARSADLELGRYLASECMTCHRAATATSQIPNIFGMSFARMTVLLTAYRDRQIPNPVMQNIAGRLNDEEIASLALFFSTAKQP